MSGECSPRTLSSTSWKADPRTPRAIAGMTRGASTGRLAVRRSSWSKYLAGTPFAIPPQLGRR